MNRRSFFGYIAGLGASLGFVQKIPATDGEVPMRFGALSGTEDRWIVIAHSPQAHQVIGVAVDGILQMGKRPPHRLDLEMEQAICCPHDCHSIAIVCFFPETIIQFECEGVTVSQLVDMPSPSMAMPRDQSRSKIRIDFCDGELTSWPI